MVNVEVENIDDAIYVWEAEKLSDEQLIQEYKQNLCLFKELQKKITGEIPTDTPINELKNYRHVMISMLKAEAKELDKRNIPREKF